MIGFIALAGTIVRNSILLVDFAIEEVRKGIDMREAVLSSRKARTRPIMITPFALMGGASVILTDPILQGIAISLLFGVFVLACSCPPYSPWRSSPWVRSVQPAA